jgi:hypothetical protein
MFAGNTPRSPITVEPIPETPPPFAAFSKPPATSPMLEESRSTQSHTPSPQVNEEVSRVSTHRDFPQQSPFSQMSIGSTGTAESFDSYFAYKPAEIPPDHWWSQRRSQSHQAESELEQLDLQLRERRTKEGEDTSLGEPEMSAGREDEDAPLGEPEMTAGIGASTLSHVEEVSAVDRDAAQMVEEWPVTPDAKSVQ